MRADEACNLACRRAGPWKRPHLIDDCAGDPKRDTQDASKAGKLDRAVLGDPNPLACCDLHAPNPRSIGRSHGFR
jgi:hypothetical protein